MVIWELIIFIQYNNNTTYPRYLFFNKNNNSQNNYFFTFFKKVAKLTMLQKNILNKVQYNVTLKKFS